MKKVDEVPDKSFLLSVGRRKTAIARARLYQGTSEVMVGDKKLERGDVYVNGVALDQFFKDPYSKAVFAEIFRTTNSAGRFIITVVVEGSGQMGQMGAVSLAISRVLVLADPKFKPILRKKDFMTRDPRMKERKKAGQPGARKKKSSPKR